MQDKFHNDFSSRMREVIIKNFMVVVFLSTFFMIAKFCLLKKIRSYEFAGERLGLWDFELFIDRFHIFDYK